MQSRNAIRSHPMPSIPRARNWIPATRPTHYLRRAQELRLIDVPSARSSPRVPTVPDPQAMRKVAASAVRARLLFTRLCRSLQLIESPIREAPLSHHLTNSAQRRIHLHPLPLRQSQRLQLPSLYRTPHRPPTNPRRPQLWER